MSQSPRHSTPPPSNPPSSRRPSITHERSDAPFDPEKIPLAQTNSHPPLVGNSWLVYASLLTSLALTLVLTISFGAVLLAKGGLPAPQHLADFAATYPRQSVLLVAILATVLAGIVKWAFSEMVIIVSKKRFFTAYRPVAEIEYLTALKNGAVVWSFEKKSKALLSTALAIGLCGLLAPGFISLLSPLPIAVTEAVGGGVELDLTLKSDVCLAWYNDLVTKLWSDPKCKAWQTFGSFTYNACAAECQLSDVLNAGKASMLNHLATELSPSPEELPKYVSSLTRLKKTRILGATGGVLPIGPAGVDIFPYSQVTIPVAAQASSKDSPSPKYNYTLSHQGLWADVNCEYVDASSSLLSWERQSDGTTSFKANCPNGTDASGSVVPSANNGLLGFASCSNAPAGSFALHLRSFWSSADTGTSNTVTTTTSPTQTSTATPPSDTPSITSSQTSTTTSPSSSSSSSSYSIPGGYATSMPEIATTSGQQRRALPTPSAAISTPSYSGSAYGGIGAMQCNITPRLSNVQAIFRTDLAGFSMGLEKGSATEANQMILDRVMAWTMNVLLEAQTPLAGNIMAEMVNALGASYYHSDGMSQNKEYPELFASMIKGIYEYEATHLRLVLAVTSAASGITLPQECVRPVEGTLVYRVIGWDSKWSTFVALLPLLIVCAVTIYFIVRTMLSRGRLTLFDPTNPLSLIASSSVGGISFPPSAVGDPEDKVVKATGVKYGSLDGGRWGLLKSET